MNTDGSTGAAAWLVIALAALAIATAVGSFVWLLVRHC